MERRVRCSTRRRAQIEDFIRRTQDHLDAFERPPSRKRSGGEAQTSRCEGARMPSADKSDNCSHCKQSILRVPMPMSISRALSGWRPPFASVPAVACSILAHASCRFSFADLDDRSSSREIRCATFANLLCTLAL